MGTLNKPEGAAAYRHLLSRLASVREDRRYGFMFQSFYLRDNLDAILGRLLRLPVDGQPVTVLDISGVPSEVVNVVVSLLCRLIFEFALWSEREHSPPILLVCEEAHRYVPADGAPTFEPTRRAIDRIAKEGRKYGVSLCLVSQRPAELSASSLAQCGTIMALRLSNERDQHFVRNALPDGFDWLIGALPALGTGRGRGGRRGRHRADADPVPAARPRAAAGEPDARPSAGPGLQEAADREFRRPHHQPLAPAAALSTGRDAAGQRRPPRDRPLALPLLPVSSRPPATRRPGASARCDHRGPPRPMLDKHYRPAAVETPDLRRMGGERRIRAVSAPPAARRSASCCRRPT